MIQLQYHKKKHLWYFPFRQRQLPHCVIILLFVSILLFLLLSLLSLLLFLLLYDFCSCKSCAYVSNSHFAALANFTTLYEDDKSLHSGNAITLSACFCNLHIIFLTCFYRLWTEATTEAVASPKSSFTI